MTMRPLDGIRVVDLTRFLAGPYCTQELGDFGADVIKIEPLDGDGTRYQTLRPDLLGNSYFFAAANRNKRSVAIDVRKEAGKEIVLRLARRADVFVENFRPGVTDRLGLGEASLRKDNPRLIYCSITGYGFTGPKAGRPGYDILAQAEAGVMSFTGEPDGGPIRYPIAIADMSCGMYAAMGILAALLAREKTGRGQFLDMALFDSQLTWLANIGSNYLNAGVSPKRWGNAHPSIVPYEVFHGSDGRHFVCLLYTSPSPRDLSTSRMPSSA